VGGGATAFYAVRFQSVEGGGVAAGTVITLGVLLALPQGVASYPLGRLGDRAGHKKGVVIGALAQAVAIAVALLGRGPIACSLCFASLGVAFASGWVSHTNMLFETCPHDSRPAHITLSNVLLSPFVILAPIGTGWLMESAGQRAGIGMTLVPTALGVLWLILAVKEPRETEARARDRGVSRST
jgi:MFS family permease